MLKAIDLEKRYFRKSGEANFFRAVDHVSLTLESGKVTVLTGRSGSGKTTLLQMMAGLLQPSEGKVMLAEDELYTFDDARLSALRAKHIAVIPQVNAAVGSLTVLENILLPAMMNGRSLQETSDTATELMERFGIAGLKDSMTSELSGGEKRRMSIVRALCCGADVILADEPTGDLDDENTTVALSLLREAADQGVAVLLVTHEDEAQKWSDQVYRMDTGKLLKHQDGRE